MALVELPLNDVTVKLYFDNNISLTPDSGAGVIDNSPGYLELLILKDNWNNHIEIKLNCDLSITELTTKNITIDTNSNDFNFNRNNNDPFVLSINNLLPKTYMMHTVPLSFYTDKDSYFVNETVSLMVHQPRLNDFYEYHKDLYNDRVFHIEILDKNRNILLTYNDIKGKQQRYKDMSFAEGCDWEECFNFQIPEYFTSDIYGIRIFQGTGTAFNDQFYKPIIVKRNEKNVKSDILVLSNTWTGHAYNAWGGLDGDISLYKWNPLNHIVNEKYLVDGSARSLKVTTQRPNSSYYHKYYYNKDRDNTGTVQSHLIEAEKLLLRWLDSNSYEYNMICDSDLHENPEIINNYKIFILNVHPEYWSYEMVSGLNNYIMKGGHFMYLGGNALWWKTTFKNNQLEVRKDYGLHDHTDEQGGKWMSTPGTDIFPIPRPHNILGNLYHSGSFNRDIYYPYKISKPTHWIFENITDSIIGTKNTNGDNINNGASGWEVDKATISDEYIIASGEAPSGVTHEGDMIYYENSTNGKVFSVGSLVYTGSLFVDNNISQVTKNVINKFLL